MCSLCSHIHLHWGHWDQPAVLNNSKFPFPTFIPTRHEIKHTHTTDFSPTIFCQQYNKPQSLSVTCCQSHKKAGCKSAATYFRKLWMLQWHNPASRPSPSSAFWWVPLLHSASQHAELVAHNYPTPIVWHLHLNKNLTRSPCRELVRSACSIRVTKHIPSVLIRELITPLGCHKALTHRENVDQSSPVWVTHSKYVMELYWSYNV